MVTRNINDQITNQVIQNTVVTPPSSPLSGPPGPPSH
jgi:hypothetical protein